MAGTPATRLGNDVLLVLGAGVDRSLGLPLMDTMFHDLNEFSLGAGKDIDAALRKQARRLSFKFGPYAGDQGEALSKKLLGSHSHLIDPVLTALAKHAQPANVRVVACLDLFSRLKGIRDQNALATQTAESLAELAADGGWDPDETILDPTTMAFRPTVRQAMRRLLSELPANIPNLTQPETDAFWELSLALANFEEMMGDFFVGYFSRNPTLQKKYFYLAWMLWAYIRIKASAATRAGSFYETLSASGCGGGVITFNYTDFFCPQTKPTYGYFHGDLGSYIDFGTRDYVGNDGVFAAATDVATICNFISGMTVDWTSRVPSVRLPALMPPLSVKPIICSEYLDRWYQCGQAIKQASKLLIVGYSFNVVDEHFNDLIRKQNPTAKLVIVNPSVDAVVEDACRVVNVSSTSLTQCTVAGRTGKEGGRLRFCPARAEDLSANDLIDLAQ